MSRRTALRVMVAAFTTMVVVATAAVGVAATHPSGVVSGAVTSTNHRWLANGVVWLEGVHGTFAPAVEPAVVDQRRLQFLPRVLPVVRGTTVRFLNSDPTQHDVYSPEGGYDLGNVPGGAHSDQVFARLGVFTQLCHLHPSTVAFVVVLPNPYFAVTGADGAFRIESVPAGTYQLKAWQEHARGGPVTVVVPSSGAVTARLALQRATE